MIVNLGAFIDWVVSNFGLMPFTETSASAYYNLILAIATFLFFLATLGTIYYSYRMSKTASEALKVNKIDQINRDIEYIENKISQMDEKYSKFLVEAYGRVLRIRRMILDLTNITYPFGDPNLDLIVQYISQLIKMHENKNSKYCFSIEFTSCVVQLRTYLQASKNNNIYDINELTVVVNGASVLAIQENNEIIHERENLVKRLEKNKRLKNL